MFDPLLSNSDISLIIMPILIFFARILDVTIGTLRIVFISRGDKIISPILGFFEVLIWTIAVARIFEHLNNYLYYIAFAGGFAVGNYVGLIIEEKLALGVVIIRSIVKKNSDKLISALREGGYGVTTVDARGGKENVKVLYSIVKRQDIEKVVNLINLYNPKSFYTIEDVRQVSHGVFPIKTTHFPRSGDNMFRRWRKGK